MTFSARVNSNLQYNFKSKNIKKSVDIRDFLKVGKQYGQRVE